MCKLTVSMKRGFREILKFVNKKTVKNIKQNNLCLFQNTFLVLKPKVESEDSRTISKNTNNFLSSL